MASTNRPSPPRNRTGRMQLRANTGLNKGEAHHAPENALRIGRQGEIRDRFSEGQLSRAEENCTTRAVDAQRKGPD